MTYLDRIFARATARKAQPGISGRLRVGGDNYNAPTADGAERQAQLYTRLSWVQTAVDIKANYVATTPLQVYQRTTGGRQGVVNHPFELRLERPNERDSRFEFLHDTSCWLDITGECYWWRNRASEAAPDDELWIIPVARMEPVPDGYGGFKGFWYNPGGSEMRIMLQPWEVVYFRTFNPLDRNRGLGIGSSLALGANADLAAQRYQLAYYDRDNAKPDGILAFGDNIDDPRWGRLQEDVKEQTGGTKRKRMLMLRNVGPGGVQWIMTHIPQSEQQFLENRTFTKEEIFARVAPGLSSILAVNATEANSTAGMNTFLSMAVYPRQVAIGQKITNTMLADGEVAEFDDVRRADTATELAQRAAYERTHTVDEVRAKYDGDGPLGDERGSMLVAQAQAVSAQAAQPTPLDLAAAAKAYERRQWRTKATKALAAGRSPDVAFTPEHLDDDEAMAIRSALKRGDLAGAFGGEA